MFEVRRSLVVVIEARAPHGQGSCDIVGPLFCTKPNPGSCQNEIISGWLQKLAEKAHAVGACAYVPCKVSKVVLRSVGARDFWHSTYQSILPGAPAAVPVLKKLLASADFRQVCSQEQRGLQPVRSRLPPGSMLLISAVILQNVSDEEVEVTRVLLALACAAKHVRDQQSDKAFSHYENHRQLKAEASSSVSKYGVVRFE